VQSEVDRAIQYGWTLVSTESKFSYLIPPHGDTTCLVTPTWQPIGYRGMSIMIPDYLTDWLKDFEHDK